MYSAGMSRSFQVVSAPASGTAPYVDALLGRSFVSITNGRELAPRGLPELRQPQWTGPDPPKPPPMHVRVLRITF